MKVLWFCNKAPSSLETQLGRVSNNFGGWLDTMFLQLSTIDDLNLAIAYPSPVSEGGQQKDFRYYSFSEGDQEAVLGIVRDFCPDVVHIWGTEFQHSRHAMSACTSVGLADSCIVSIQGLVSVCGNYHYLEGIPPKVALRSTFRDHLRHDNIVQARKRFVQRGTDEIECLKLARHVVGRTEWDRACCELLAPHAEYHFCNETLREPFYKGIWTPRSINRHSIFASQCGYPIKGFHFLLQALPMILKKYPDATVYTTGPDLMSGSLKRRMRMSSYQKYLVELIVENHLEKKVKFLGSLNANQMRDQYLSSHAFVSPSTIENSSNSIGEAMMLGCPVVASNCGGTSSLIRHGRDGLLYQTTAPYMLASYIDRIFSDDDFAQLLSMNAHREAALRHDKEKNFKTLLSIYNSLAERKKQAI